MGLILNIETATKNCSVSISKDGEILVMKELNNGNYSHAEMLHPFIKEIISEADLTFSDLDAVAVSKGPGSYTGLRIGVSAAKGFAYSLDIPLISVPTLEVLANSISIDEGSIVPMLDARRMEVYSAIFNSKKEQTRAIKAEIIDENSFSEVLEKEKVHFVGDAVEKCEEVIKHENAIFYESKFPSAKEMGKLAETKFKNEEFEDVAYFEPFYLKDFVVTPSKKKI
ncbi:tRNA (adenosine(37)-N6)-threonylcarbamoyltransferase complex dimerization subunit type 1 TsaB [Aureivirga sp. CE67]|uniref:tRNA (adenosine(37)-N6)-threonylcarbamoyltransferase complex dimerization subunit type 1 TsaB n=1 Tax=Aureivirga sp. CE67 TaxID=1788983 RepID=UPI0018C8F49D|nr:tRNA (adenosine(37)-N6)-threonylcarbamoyltransferase complex dimerization subunit type 1 TsaB [Aureivirga sp. CE67]